MECGRRIGLVFAWMGILTLLDFSQASGVAEADAQNDMGAAKPDQPSAHELQEATNRYACEPSIDEVIKATIWSAKHESLRIDSLSARARASGIVPQARLFARRNFGNDFRYGDDYAARTTLGNDLSLGAGLYFRLDRLMFASEEIGLHRERRVLTHRVADLVRQTVHHYYERRRLELERDVLKKASVHHVVAISELETLIDLTTKHVFQKRWSCASGKAERAIH